MRRPIQALAVLAVLGLGGVAGATSIASEDFETGAAGWSNPTRTAAGAPFTTFLGRFGGTGGSQAVWKEFALSGTETQVELQFDFFEIDSWDYEYFNVFVDDAQIVNDQFKHNRADDPALADPTFGADGNTNFGFADWPDQGFTYHLTVATTATSLKLGFGSTLDQGIGDESWGIDNVVITDNSRPAPPVGTVPEPGTMVLLGSGLMALAGTARRRLRK